jgi:hypothetical protein
MFHNRMSLAATYFHDYPRTARRRMDFIDDVLYEGSISEFGSIYHARLLRISARSDFVEQVDCFECFCFIQ